MRRQTFGHALGTGLGALLALAIALGWAGVVGAAQTPQSTQQDAGATATALIRMQQSIFATQTAVAAPVESSPTATLRPTSTAVVRVTATPTRAAPAATATRAAVQAQPAAASTPSPMPQASPALTVLLDGINLRAGPGSAYQLVGSAKAGAQYPAVGQAGGCAWLQIKLPSGGTVWITGANVYTRLNGACDRLPVVRAPGPTPTRSVAAGTPVTPLPGASGEGPTAITIVSPSSPLNVDGFVVFAWKPNAPLGPNQVFEVVFWSAGQSVNQGRALNQASSATSVKLNVDDLALGPHNWGVFLANASPYQRVRYLGDGGTINVRINDDVAHDMEGGNAPAPDQPERGNP